ARRGAGDGRLIAGGEVTALEDRAAGVTLADAEIAEGRDVAGDQRRIVHRRIARQIRLGDRDAARDGRGRDARLIVHGAVGIDDEPDAPIALRDADARQADAG